MLHKLLRVEGEWPILGNCDIISIECGRQIEDVFQMKKLCGVIKLLQTPNGPTELKG